MTSLGLPFLSEASWIGTCVSKFLGCKGAWSILLLNYPLFANSHGQRLKDKIVYLGYIWDLTTQFQQRYQNYFRVVHLRLRFQVNHPVSWSWHSSPLLIRLNKLSRESIQTIQAVNSHLYKCCQEYKIQIPNRSSKFQKIQPHMTENTNDIRSPLRPLSLKCIFRFTVNAIDLKQLLWPIQVERGM